MEYLEKFIISILTRIVKSALGAKFREIRVIHLSATGHKVDCHNVAAINPKTDIMLRWPFLRIHAVAKSKNDHNVAAILWSFWSCYKIADTKLTIEFWRTQRNAIERFVLRVWYVWFRALLNCNCRIILVKCHINCHSYSLNWKPHRYGIEKCC